MAVLVCALAGHTGPLRHHLAPLVLQAECAELVGRVVAGAGRRRRRRLPGELRLRSGATCPVRLQLGRRWPRPPRKTGTVSLPRATMCPRQSRRKTRSLTICRGGRETVRSRESRRPPPSPSGQPEGIPQQDQEGGPDFPLIMRDFPLCSIVNEHRSAEPRTVPKVGNGVDVPERPQKHRPGATGKTFSANGAVWARCRRCRRARSFSGAPVRSVPGGARRHTPGARLNGEPSPSDYRGVLIVGDRWAPKTP